MRRRWPGENAAISYQLLAFSFIIARDWADGARTLRDGIERLRVDKPTLIPMQQPAQDWLEAES